LSNPPIGAKEDVLRGRNHWHIALQSEGKIQVILTVILERYLRRKTKEMKALMAFLLDGLLAHVVLRNVLHAYATIYKVPMKGPEI
jgi:hypothetical protein